MNRQLVARRIIASWIAAAGLVMIVAAATAQIPADDPYDIRHGTIPVSPADAEIAGGLVLTYQATDDERIEDELLASIDLVGRKAMGPGFWTLYVEGATTSQPNGVATRIPEANGDAVSAINQQGQGRLQVSVLHYLWQWKRSGVAVGLIDPTGPLDHSDVANDETRQFLNNFFVNNPSIAFPDYTLGAVLFYKPSVNAPDLTFVLSSSAGLADNPQRSYSQLFDIGEEGKGVFAAAQSHWQRDGLEYTLGAWVQTADNARLDGSLATQDNYGLYGVVEAPYRQWSWSVRAGFANDEVSAVANFISLAVQWSTPARIVGLAVGRAGASSALGATRDDTYVAELYARYRLADRLHLTPGLQYVRNSALDASGTVVDPQTGIASMRLVYLF